MTASELFAAMSDRSLCISCLATVTATLERDDLLELFVSGDMDSRMDTCVGCKRATLATYRFHRAHKPAA